MIKEIDRYSIPTSVLTVCKILEEQGFEAWVVGGCVRDTLLGRTPKDWDIATDARPNEVVPLFSRVEPTGIEHGTVTVIETVSGMHHAPIEITTFRGDGKYTDGRRPDEVEFLSSIMEDLKRRDFTINAMAFRPQTKCFMDPFDGRYDIRFKRIKAVGEPMERFNEDGLRIMRACRFAAQLGFWISAETKEAMIATVGNLKNVAAERVTTEVEKLFTAYHSDKGLEIMVETGVIKHVFPEFGGNHPLAGSLVKDMQVIDFGVQLGCFMSYNDLSYNTLKLSAKDRKKAIAIVNGKESLKTLSANPVAIRKWIQQVGKENVGDILNVGKTYGIDESFLKEVWLEWQDNPPVTVKELALNGYQVQEVLGLIEGKEMGKVLNKMLEWVIEQPYRNKPHLLTMGLMKEYRGAK